MNGARLGKVAYVMSRFPKLTETFILYEMLAVERLGIQIELYPLLRERSAVAQPEAQPLVQRAHYLPFLSWPILRSQLHFLRHSPRRYLGTLARVVRATAGSWNFLVGALAIFAKVAHAARLMQRDGVTHVHCHFANHPATAGYVVNRLVSIPYSFTAHGSDLHMDRHMLREKVAAATFVVAISDFNRRLILSECGEEYASKVVVIHCGVDVELFAARDGRQASRPFSILCVGTLHEVKGQRHLIEACRLLAQAQVDFICQFVGDGEDRQRLAAQVAEAGLSDRITFLGPRTRDGIVDLLSQADLLVAPSVPTASGKREGIPVVLMEAMSSGVPVISSRLSGIPELVEDGRTGILTPAGDAAALAAAIRRVHDDPDLRRRLSEAARATVEREFNVTRNAERLARQLQGASA